MSKTELQVTLTATEYSRLTTLYRSRQRCRSESVSIPKLLTPSHYTVPFLQPQRYYRNSQDLHKQHPQKWRSRTTTMVGKFSHVQNRVWTSRSGNGDGAYPILTACMFFSTGVFILMPALCVQNDLEHEKKSDALFRDKANHDVASEQKVLSKLSLKQRATSLGIMSPEHREISLNGMPEEERKEVEPLLEYVLQSLERAEIHKAKSEALASGWSEDGIARARYSMTLLQSMHHQKRETILNNVSSEVRSVALHSMSPQKRLESIRSFPADLAADAITNMLPGVATQVVTGVSPEQRQHILHEMSPNYRALTLMDLPEEERDQLLHSMSSEDRIAIEDAEQIARRIASLPSEDRGSELKQLSHQERIATLRLMSKTEAGITLALMSAEEQEYAMSNVIAMKRTSPVCYTSPSIRAMGPKSPNKNMNYLDNGSSAHTQADALCAMVDEQLSAALHHMSSGDKAKTLAILSPSMMMMNEEQREQMIAIMQTMSDKEIAGVFHSMTPEDRTVALSTELSSNERVIDEDYLVEAKIFLNLPPQERLAAIHDLMPDERAHLLMAMTTKQRSTALVTMSDDDRSETLAMMEPHEKSDGLLGMKAMQQTATQLEMIPPSPRATNLLSMVPEEREATLHLMSRDVRAEALAKMSSSERAIAMMSRIDRADSYADMPAHMNASTLGTMLDDQRMKMVHELRPEDRALALMEMSSDDQEALLLLMESDDLAATVKAKDLIMAMKSMSTAERIALLQNMSSTEQIAALHSMVSHAPPNFPRT